MCGIIGVASKRPIKNYNWVKAGLDEIYHRGPDGEGIFINENKNIVLGHRRLSIIDLSEMANQPMFDFQKRYVIIFNGEIYNFRSLRKILIKNGLKFKTKSDTEVLVNSYKFWGDSCLDHITGMFSFAIYDKLNNNVFLARDRAGEKPLYYSHKNGELKFASELKGLMTDNNFKRKIDKDSLDNLLAWGYVNNDKSIFEDVNKLPAAHAMIYDINTNTKKIWKYWKLPNYNTDNDLSDDELLKECEKILENSVKNQLIADVPLGVLLSGGIDSSLITALAARNSNKLNTYTITFPGYSKYDERKHAKLISDYFNTNHTELPASDVSVDLLDKLAKQYDEPIFDSSIIPTYFVTKLVKENCTVAIGGDGGDELFGGYTTYSRMLKIKKYYFAFKYIRKDLEKFAKKYLPVGFKGRNWLINNDIENSLTLSNGPFDDLSRKKLMSMYKKWETKSEDLRNLNMPICKDLIQRATRMDFHYGLSEDMLVKVDRASMLNSLELRAPFLDHKLIEFAFEKVPSRLKVKNGLKKILLKKLSRSILPTEFDINRKAGFSIPLNEWFKNDLQWKSFLFDTINSKDSFFDNKFINQLYKNHQKGFSNSERLFGILMFELWRKKYNVTI